MFGTMQEALIRDIANKFPAAWGCKHKREALPTTPLKKKVTISVKRIQDGKGSCYKQSKRFELDLSFG